jgi:membrane associated rhomboid family serine protease
MTLATDKPAKSGVNFALRHAFALTATTLLASVIAYLMLSPPKTAPSGVLSDKTYHAIAFAGLVFPSAVFYARSLIWMVPVALVFGGVLELIQPYFGRQAEATDFIADAMGIAVGVGIGLLIRRGLFKPIQ